MKARSEKKYTIVDAVLEGRVNALDKSFLVQIDKCVDWLKLRTLINKKEVHQNTECGMQPCIRQPNALQDFTLRNMIQLERRSGGRANQRLYHLQQVYQPRLRAHCPRS